MENSLLNHGLSRLILIAFVLFNILWKTDGLKLLFILLSGILAVCKDLFLSYVFDKDDVAIVATFVVLTLSFLYLLMDFMTFKLPVYKLSRSSQYKLYTAKKT